MSLSRKEPLSEETLSNELLYKEPLCEERLNRRGFLQIAGLLTLGTLLPPLAQGSKTALAASPAAGQPKNVLIVVYDAWSAHNVPLYGYARDTMPHLTRLAEKAVVYHNHLAGGNFTTPGTATMLTGAYPWTHRAFSLNETIDKRFLTDDDHRPQNIFRAFPNHHRLAYTHNPYANVLLRQMVDEIEELIKPEELFFYFNRFLSTLFENDDDIAYLSWLRTFESRRENSTNSLFLSQLLGPVMEKIRQEKVKKYADQFPRGVPSVKDNYFLLEHATDSLANTLIKGPRPFMGYLHFLPPHTPYCTRLDFYQHFKKDGYQTPDKPRILLSENEPLNVVENLRRQYDEYLLYVDHEFNRLYGLLEAAGLLEDTWLILTSDHGEMFERGTLKHTTITMYQPVIHVPLLIFEPGRKQREDIYLPTNGVDLLPTLLQITGQAVPPGYEGAALPPYASPDLLSERSTYSMRIKKNAKYAPITQGSIVMVKDFKKLSYYFGYPELEPLGGELVELYDLEQDSEELHNLVQDEKRVAAEMVTELKEKLDQVNQQY
jgi:arylsulfatase A-like enzyme